MIREMVNVRDSSFRPGVPPDTCSTQQIECTLTMTDRLEASSEAPRPPTPESIDQSIDEGDLQRALDDLDRLEASRVDNAEISRLRSRVAARSDEPIAAIEMLDLAMDESSPADGDLINRAQYCHVAGRLEEALATLDRIPRKTTPQVAAASAHLKARCFTRLRRPREAEAALRDLSAIEGRSPRIEWLRSELDQSLGDFASSKRRLEITIATRGLPASLVRPMAFDLAKACDRLADFDTAFKFATEGNRLTGSTFDADAYREDTDRIIEFFDASRLAALPRSSKADDSPVFLVGMPRSGTSLVEQIIATHPRGAGIGEQRMPLNLAARIAHRRGIQFPACLDDIGIDDLDDLDELDELDDAADRYLSMQASFKQDADRIVNKTLGLDRILGFLPLILPGCRIIHVTRDPLDNILSMFLHSLRGDTLSWACRLDDLILARQEHDRLMDHFGSILPVPFHQVRYEDLVTRQAEVTDGLLHFLGLAPEPACLDFHLTRRNVMTPSHDQIDKPMNAASIGRWRNYERHLRPAIEVFGPRR